MSGETVISESFKVRKDLVCFLDLRRFRFFPPLFGHSSTSEVWRRNQDAAKDT